MEAETISMMHSTEISLPDHISGPNLSALLLTWCSSIGRIPNGFLQAMFVLTCLDLSYIGVKEIPPTLAILN